MADWIWSGNLSPGAFPNNLARYFLQIPGVFEQQLNFSTSLIFDEPSFRNGIQVSGFIDRPIRELVINFLGQLRHSWYTMTHHAVLGTLTAHKHGIPDQVYADKLVCVTEFKRHPDTYTRLEREIFKFAEAFATNPKTWTDDDCVVLKSLFREENKQRYPQQSRWMAQLDAARKAQRSARATGNVQQAEGLSAQAATDVPADLPEDVNERMVNAQLVELAFLCLQFVALTDVFSALNIPDESFFPDFMTGVLKPEVIAKLNELNSLGGEGLPDLVPPKVQLPVEDIVAGLVEVEAAPLKGSRVPLVSYEIDTDQATRDKGLAVGGVQAGVWGWSFGSYFPGGLVYLLMHHPELARFEAPYSLPLLFNEDEWRNGTQTAGFVTRRLKEIVYLKIYTTTRARYGLEHHTMFLFNIFRDEFGVGRPPRPKLSKQEEKSATALAIQHAEHVVIYVQDSVAAPPDTYTPLELATMDWVERVITRPHAAHLLEARLRTELDAENRREVAARTRRLDTSPGIGLDAAYRRLVDHQIAELAMLTGHMDGLGRAMTILRLESEDAVTAGEPKNQDTKGKYMTTRGSLFDAYDYVGVSKLARTANELRLNPALLEDLMKGDKKSPISGSDAAKTGEF